MPDRLEGRLRWLFGGVAVVLVTAGTCAVLVATRAEPAQGGADATLYSSVVAVLGAALAVVLALSALVVWSPRRFTHLMPVLSLACGAAALGFVGALATRDDTASAAVAGVVVASLLALACALGWLALWLAPRPGVATAARDAELFGALLATMVPSGASFDLGADDEEIRAGIVHDFAARTRRDLPLLRIVLRALDLRSIVKHRSGFAALDQARRESLVVGLASSRSARVRAIGVLLRDVVLTRVYGDPRVREQIGDDVAWVQARIDAGPNADAHRARREEAARRAAEAEEAARLAAALASGALAADAQVDDGLAVEPTAPAPDLESSVAPASEPLTSGRRSPERAPSSDSPSSTAPTPTPAPSDAPRRSPADDDEPFDRAWTLGVPKEPTTTTMRAPVLRVARAGGPTRP